MAYRRAADRGCPTTKNDTVIVADFKRSMEHLRPYFEIKNQVMAQYPQLQQAANMAEQLARTDAISASQFRSTSQELKFLNQMVKQIQEQVRIQYPIVDAALVKYFGAVPMEYQMLQDSAGGGSNQRGGVFSRVGGFIR